MDSVKMLGVDILDSEYCDCLEDGTQYYAEKWHLKDMEQYTNKYVVIGFDGSLRIYEAEGDLLFNGLLTDSIDFVKKLKVILKEKSNTIACVKIGDIVRCFNECSSDKSEHRFKVLDIKRDNEKIVLTGEDLNYQTNDTIPIDSDCIFVVTDDNFIGIE